MHIAIVDDQKIEIKLLTKYIDTYMAEKGLNNYEVSSFLSADSFLESFEKDTYSLIFLDIYMEKMNGVELARKIRDVDSNSLIVFSTSSNEFAMESYEVNAKFYLVKPYTYESFSSMMKLVLPEKTLSKQFTTLSDGKKFIPINVIYSEYFNHKITVHQKYDEDFSTRLSQNEFEEALSEFDYLISCNRGIIINLNEVKKLDTDSVTMSDKSVLPVSRGKYAIVKQAYEDFKLKEISKNI